MSSFDPEFAVLSDVQGDHYSTKMEIDSIVDMTPGEHNPASYSQSVAFGIQTGTMAGSHSGNEATSFTSQGNLAVPMNVPEQALPQQFVCPTDNFGHLCSINFAPPNFTLQSAQSSKNQILQVPLPSLQQNLLISTTGSLIGMQPLPASTVPITQMSLAGLPHNLIPQHLQASALAPSLHGTPGYQPALVSPYLAFAANAIPPVNAYLPIPCTLPALPAPQPALTVQDRPFVTPVFNGVNPSYPGVQQVHLDPPVFVVDSFLTPFECDFLVHAANDSWTPAPVVGKGAGEISSSRTSSTCYLAREDLPDYMRKVSMLTNKPIEHCELPQVGRYLPNQQYLHHFDAFDLSNEDGRRFASNGGQRVVTVLVYLNDCASGGQTQFPALNFQVSPRRGTALVFFPASVDGLLDKRALHAALPAIDVKYVSQVWIRQTNYNGLPSKRLEKTLGVPFDAIGQASALLGLQSPV